MRKQNLQLVREACFKSNPEIREQEINTRTREGKLQNIVGWEPRPIRLADVLDAMCFGEFDNMPALRAEQEKAHQVVIMWNLHKDDLTEQSDETISFLADLLSPKE